MDGLLRAASFCQHRGRDATPSAASRFPIANEFSVVAIGGLPASLVFDTWTRRHSHALAATRLFSDPMERRVALWLPQQESKSRAGSPNSGEVPNPSRPCRE